MLKEFRQLQAVKVPMLKDRGVLLPQLVHTLKVIIQLLALMWLTLREIEPRRRELVHTLRVILQLRRTTMLTLRDTVH
jgi:hypothetical protein